MTRSRPRPALDQPDDTHGEKDPFVIAVQTWTSIEKMRRNGVPEKDLVQLIRSMDDLMIYNRRTLLDQYVQIPISARTAALRQSLGLAYWGNGALLAMNDRRKAT